MYANILPETEVEHNTSALFPNCFSVAKLPNGIQHSKNCLINSCSDVETLLSINDE